MNDENILIYNYKLQNSKNEEIEFSQFRGKVVIIVNVASLCGFTPQYNELQQLYNKYHDHGLEILAFPCNQFAHQEPLSDLEIETSVRKKFNVTFPIMKKINVNGDYESKFYKYLKEQQKDELGFKGIRWNFTKFIIDKQGKVITRFDSFISPLQFESYIKQLLSF
ncbi:unnamed protein product [Candida verbasci]|uniref:Glutathione peroxidase n=1 Tax=Candida verbasci TaxID=1227364 RepID=A0A9W4TVZ3_9ASCO|nr:unnamed protein product [Candida verbasci]